MNIRKVVTLIEKLQTKIIEVEEKMEPTDYYYFAKREGLKEALALVREELT